MKNWDFTWDVILLYLLKLKVKSNILHLKALPSKVYVFAQKLNFLVSFYFLYLGFRDFAASRQDDATTARAIKFSNIQGVITFNEKEVSNDANCSFLSEEKTLVSYLKSARKGLTPETGHLRNLDNLFFGIRIYRWNRTRNVEGFPSKNKK